MVQISDDVEKLDKEELIANIMLYVRMHLADFPDRKKAAVERYMLTYLRNQLVPDMRYEVISLRCTPTPDKDLLGEGIKRQINLASEGYDRFMAKRAGR
jgi:hypothetical protein